ncbi:Protein of unknown function DUF669 [uncultured Caudovirales phage]|uniref:DUF669 domain-containing protein n=1 Tax=uncultured Caudovirales phage TaxID=2100421 RepID=A0A6J5KN01_9CAUD|nr:Protein of unknown function DUF669 [uncultured Caudovirales phage]
MANLAGFDASQVPEQQEFSALPEGQYVVIASASEEKITKKGDGKYLQITFEVLDGPQKGRKLWARLNLWNPNQTAKDIAQRELGAICRAVGVIRPNDSTELHNKPLLVTVTVEKDDRNRENNEIKKYEPVNGAPAPAPTAFAPAAQQQPMQQAAPAPAAAAPAPWAR